MIASLFDGVPTATAAGSVIKNWFNCLPGGATGRRIVGNPPSLCYLCPELVIQVIMSNSADRGG